LSILLVRFDDILILVELRDNYKMNSTIGIIQQGALRNLFVVALSLLSTCVFAFSGFDIREIQENHKERDGMDFSFPIISSESRGQAAVKINTYLQSAILHIKVGTEEASIFENIWPSDSSYVVNLKYVIHRNDEALFTITFWITSLGASFSYERYSFNFDSHTGDFLSLGELIQGEKNNELNEQVSKSFRSDIFDGYFFEIWKNDHDYDSYGSEILIHLLECSELEFDDLLIGKDSIYLGKREVGCLASVDGFADIDWQAAFSYQEVIEYFNQRGKGYLKKVVISDNAEQQRMEITNNIDDHVIDTVGLSILLRQIQEEFFFMDNFPADIKIIQDSLIEICDENRCACILLTGGFLIASYQMGFGNDCGSKIIDLKTKEDVIVNTLNSFYVKGFEIDRKRLNIETSGYDDNGRYWRTGTWSFLNRKAELGSKEY